MNTPILLALTLLQATAAFGQGLLTPPGAPEPTQRSLQEIWDRLNSTKLQVTKQNEEIYDLNKEISAEITGIQGRLDDATAEQKAQNTELQTQVTSLQTQLAQLRSDNQLLTGLVTASSTNLSFIVSTVDSAGVVGRHSSLAFGPDGQPAISYIEILNDNQSNLKFARFNGSIWIKATVDSVGNYVYNGSNNGNSTSLAFDRDGRPVIAYKETTNGDLKVARFNGQYWGTTTVDSAGDVGSSCSLAIGSDGQPAIAYYDSTNYNLKFARFDGYNWTTATVDGVGEFHSACSLAFGPDGQPAIVYNEMKFGGQYLIKFARFDGSIWTTSVVAQQAFGGSMAIAFGPNGHPAISYWDRNFTGLRLAHSDGTAYDAITADNGIDSGSANAIAFGPDGQPTIAYREYAFYGFLGKLKLARFNGAVWTTSYVDAAAINTFSLAFGPDGQPAISYGTENGELKFARRGLFKPVR